MFFYFEIYVFATIYSRNLVQPNFLFLIDGSINRSIDLIR